MSVNWPIIIFLFGLSLPGVYITMPRLIRFLLPGNSDALKQKFSRIAVVQTLIMVFVMSFSGAVLSLRTGFHTPFFEVAKVIELNDIPSIWLPTILFAVIGLIVFCGLYYGVVESILDEKSLEIMSKLRAAIGLDGCILYGGVVEEVIARWGLMNLIAFSIMAFVTNNNDLVAWMAILISGLMFGIGQLPAYLAAGCVSSRRLIYCILLLYLWQSMVFGYLYWQYGLISAIIAHMIFHLGWWVYDRV